MLLCYIENVNIVRSIVTDSTSGAMVLLPASVWGTCIVLQ